MVVAGHGDRIRAAMLKFPRTQQMDPRAVVPLHGRRMIREMA
jgi:hypothetical protein